MDNLWAEVGECFDTDDGSLPGILVAGLSPAGVSAVYKMLRRRSRPFGLPGEFWSNVLKTSVPIDSVPDAAALVAAGEAEPFHRCVDGLLVRDVKLPVLGVFVWTNAVELDYCMGRRWGPAVVAGLFELLRDCCALDPGAVVAPAESEGPPYPDRFVRAWACYSKHL